MGTRDRHQAVPSVSRMMDNSASVRAVTICAIRFVHICMERSAPYLFY
jgi:hypothetical protein